MNTKLVIYPRKVKFSKGFYKCLQINYDPLLLHCYAKKFF